MSSSLNQSELQKKRARYWLLLLLWNGLIRVFAATWIYRCFGPLSLSCGHDRVWHDARTNPRALCDSRLSAQPRTAGRDLGHHADRQAQIWWPAGFRPHAVAAAFPGQSGEEVPDDQSRGARSYLHNDSCICSSWFPVFISGLVLIINSTCKFIISTIPDEIELNIHRDKHVLCGIVHKTGT